MEHATSTGSSTILSCMEFTSKELSMPVFLEVCCGSAGLSASMTDHGIEGIGVDFKYNKHMPKVKVIDMD